MTDLRAAWRRNPSVSDLIVLVAAAEQGGVSAGARELGIAQPNASRALRRLEHHLGLALFVRSTRGAVLTQDGAVVVDWARQVLDANRRLLDGVAALTRTGATLRIAASHTIAEDLLPRWLAALRAEHPDVAVELTVGNSAQVGRLVGGGGVLGFVESPQVPSTIGGPAHSRTVSTDRLVVVVAPDHDWARRTRPIPREELAATPLVVREAGSGTRISFEQAMAGFALAKPALELVGNAAVRVAVMAGAGPAVLSELAVHTAVAAGELRAVMVDELVIERPLRAVWVGEEAPAPALRSMLEIAARRSPAGTR
ncbi:LysR family transcriptional regulator [Propionicimonas sp.]|uniref:LysR family transcriptional regulator n=1 Tax=Propionicimonas sp. TaxID=1955623 RepID=UPI0039E4F658